MPPWSLLLWLGVQFVCPGVSVRPTADYSFAVGSAQSAVAPASAYTWLVNGKQVASGNIAQMFLLHADGNAVSAESTAPLTAKGVSYAPGRWNSALTVASGGALSYPTKGSINLSEGSIEMWIAPLSDGTDPVYSAREHALFYYQASNGDYLKLAQTNSQGILYGGGTVGGQWESAYGSHASMSGWKAGEWHHVVFTFSASASRMRFYLDGILTADTNEKHYTAPAASGDRFYLGTTPSGTNAAYLMDEIRIWSRPMTAAEVQANAARLDQPRNDEVWLPLAGYSPGDSIAFQIGACPSPAYVYPGIPISQVNPASTLLPPGTTDLALSLQTAQPASCGYALGTAIDYPGMTPFASGQGTTSHQTKITGLSPDTRQVNDVYVRCSSAPDYALHLLYRSLPQVKPGFPRTGNLWGSDGVKAKGLEHAARIDLYLGADFSPSEIKTLRNLNPNILILISINTVENSGLPDDYYLHDIHGNKIEVWPGTYRLNLTKSYVAEYQAQYAYQLMMASGMMVDGCFFDNFFTTQSWLKTDIYGNPVQIDANGDGKPDDPAWLDAAWGQGVFHELDTWRALMPYALASGHLPRPPDAPTSAIFNGDSFGFLVPETIEGTQSFLNFWSIYNNWYVNGRQPVITMTEGAPPYQIGYGYDYNPLANIPPSTLEFARTYYPYMRFGLMFALMNDGYFAYEFGDTEHGQDWWYDELDFDLGSALGPAARVSMGSAAPVNAMVNGSFEQPIVSPWRLTASQPGTAAQVIRDTSTAADGSASARITVTAADGTDWHIEFCQLNRSLVQGKSYDLAFWAKADVPRPITLSTQQNVAPWQNYGLSTVVNLTTAWQRYAVSFQANATASDARIQFFLGAQTGTVWLDNVSLEDHPADVYRRDFEHGIALLNGTREQQTIAVGQGFLRIKGDQAPRHEYIVDDASAGFTATGNWKTVVYDSGMWKAAGPFYHNWGASCHQLTGQTGTAQWDLALREDDTYTIAAWWAAAPSASSWSNRVVYEVVSGGKVVATAAMDQTTGGDQWHVIATVPLTVVGAPFVRIHNEGSGPAIADALHVMSAARYNDGSPATTVTLEPMDGIILQRTQSGAPRRKR